VVRYRHEHDGHVCLVGGGPSLPDTLEELKWRASIGQKVWALNGAARYLYNHGICPDVLVVADARAENVEFLAELNAGAAVYLASQCHPGLFDAANDWGLDPRSGTSTRRAWPNCWPMSARGRCI
jgi:hypothetical protein